MVQGRQLIESVYEFIAIVNQIFFFKQYSFKKLVDSNW